jgi:hypothetical protein
MPHSSYKLRLLIRHRQVNSTFWLVCVVVIALRIRRFLVLLVRPNAVVEVTRGCMISREPFRQLLSQIHDGQFDDYLSRPSW